MKALNILPDGYSQIYEIDLQKNKKNIMSSSLLAMSLLSIPIINGCSKFVIEQEKDVFELTDSTKTSKGVDVNSGIEIVIDDSLSVIEHTIIL